MWEYMERRAVRCAEYILETGATVRDCAAHSTFYLDNQIEKQQGEHEMCSPSFVCPYIYWIKFQKVLIF